MYSNGAKLSTYYKELLDGGIPEDTANDMVRDAGQELLRIVGLNVAPLGSDSTAE